MQLLEFNYKEVIEKPFTEAFVKHIEIKLAPLTNKKAYENKYLIM